MRWCGSASPPSPTVRSARPPGPAEPVGVLRARAGRHRAAAAEAEALARTRHLVILAEIVTRWPALQRFLHRSHGTRTGLQLIADAADDDEAWPAVAHEILGGRGLYDDALATLRDLLRRYDGRPSPTSPPTSSDSGSCAGMGHFLGALCTIARGATSQAADQAPSRSLGDRLTTCGTIRLMVSKSASSCNTINFSFIAVATTRWSATDIAGDHFAADRDVPPATHCPGLRTGVCDRSRHLPAVVRPSRWTGCFRRARHRPTSIGWPSTSMDDSALVDSVFLGRRHSEAARRAASSHDGSRSTDGQP